jgi:hypothetical protein
LTRVGKERVGKDGVGKDGVGKERENERELRRVRKRMAESPSGKYGKGVGDFTASKVFLFQLI